MVPRSSRFRLLTLLNSARDASKYHDPISLKRLDKQTGLIARAVRCWLHAGIAALIQNLKGRAYPIFTGIDKQTPGFGLLERAIRARFVLFRVRDGLQSLNDCMDYGARMETTFRMALKGGLTLLSGPRDSWCIRSVHFDGHEHYRRNVDLRRIVDRIGVLPPGVTFHHELNLDDRTSDHREKEAQSYDDCQLLQLTDLLVGGFRTILGESTSQAQRNMCVPLQNLIDRWEQGPARMRNSRWSKGFCLSNGYLENGQWNFDGVYQPRETGQHELFQRGRST